MTTTHNPTAEQVVTEALKAVEKNIGPRGTYDSWTAEVSAVVSALRAHGLLSEGAPSEEQFERAALAGMNKYRADHDYPPLTRLLDLGREEAHRQVESMRAALTAAGVAPQGKLSVASVLPVGDDSSHGGDDDRCGSKDGPEDERCSHQATVAALNPEKVAGHMEDYYDRWSGPGEESPTFRDYADAFCEAYKEGKLT